MSACHINLCFIQPSVFTVLFLMSPLPLEAEFALNFAPMAAGGSGGWGSGGTSGGWSNVECGATSTGSTGSSGWGGSRGGSSSFSFGRGCGTGYFLQEVAKDGTFHVIVGDPKSDFALEFYIKGASNLVTGYLDNDKNPLSSNSTMTGNGAGDPTNVQIRELVKNAGMNQEFLKALNAKKPKISQDINDASLSSKFAADMTNSTYSQMFGGTITNLETIFDTGSKPLAAASFDMSRDASVGSYVTAGKYTNPGGEFKKYTYVSGGFDVYNIKWVDFCDPKQNPDHKCNIGGSTGIGHGGWSSGGGGGW